MSCVGKNDELGKIIWEACDSFRGIVDSVLYKDYILSMLFLKHVSDEYENNKQIKIRLDSSSTFDFLYKNKDVEDIGKLINDAFSKIESLNSLGNIFKTDFDHERLGSEKNIVLRHLLEDFSRLNLGIKNIGDRDALGSCYEFLISKFASESGKKGGEFFTPAKISSLLAKLVSPTKDSTIYDPTCGCGSLLVRASRQASDARLFGQEKNAQTYSLCKINMLLNDLDASIEWGDTIRNPKHVVDGKLRTFDFIVANPPFSLDKWGYEYALNDAYGRFIFGLPQKGNGDFAFVLHMLSCLNPGGTIGTILPHGILFRSGKEAIIRKNILDRNLFDAVISLPKNVFYGTSMPACILIFKKDKNDESIIFVDTSSDFVKQQGKNTINDLSIDKIVFFPCFY